MEFLQHSRRRSLLSESVYVLLNIAFAVAALIAVSSTGNIWVGLFIVLLGKWRVLAVRPHYWAANIMANMVDIIVSLSFIALVYSAAGQVVVQVSLTVLYIAWLLLLKPRSKRVYVVWQALIAIIFGTAALMQLSYDWIATWVVVAMWIIGFIATRHVLGAYKEPHAPIYSLIWGLVLAELGWLFYHWTYAFELGTGPIMLALPTIVIALVSFLAERTYASYHKHGKVVMSDISLPLLFSVSIILVGFARAIQLYSGTLGG